MAAYIHAAICGSQKRCELRGCKIAPSASHTILDNNDRSEGLQVCAIWRNIMNAEGNS